MARKSYRGRSRDPAYWQPTDQLACIARPVRIQSVWRDPLLLPAFLLAGLVAVFQLELTLVQLPWKSSVTDWLRAALAWPELLVLVLISLWLTRQRRSDSLAWWMLSIGFLMYAIGQNLWAVEDQLTFRDGVPHPAWSDLFYLLQYPCFFLALVLLPRFPPPGQSVVLRGKVLLDCLLVTTAATALCWYFLLQPHYVGSEKSLLNTLTELAYPVGDLGVLFGLVLLLAYRRSVERGALALLIGAFVCLAFADSWSASITIYMPYVGGNPPDLFWTICYLLFPLAGLVQFRLAQRELATQQKSPPDSMNAPLLGGTLIGSFRFLFPFVAALLAGGALLLRTNVVPDGTNSPLAPLGVTLGLLILVIARQELTFLESEHWRREREIARANELAALQEANQRMDTFLGMASHELKTPLSSMLLSIQMLQRRKAYVARLMTAEDTAAAGDLLKLTLEQHGRLSRLVNDLLDVSRIRASKLELHLEWVDLAAIVRQAAEEQSQAAQPHRLRLRLPANLAVPLFVDAGRIGQVVTNYLTNALKYSPEASQVQVGINYFAQQVRVWVLDEGPGIPPEEQKHIWDRFYRVKGVEVQNGSGIGLGLGLHICRTIVERHRGQIGVTSAPGKGSTFWFTLPLEPPDEHAPQRDDSESRV